MRRGEGGTSVGGVCWTRHGNQGGVAEGCSTCKNREPRAAQFRRHSRPSAASPLSTWAARPCTHQNRRGSGAGSPRVSESRKARGRPTSAPEPWRGRRGEVPPRYRPEPAGISASRHPRFRVTRCARASQVPARLPSWLRWRRPGSCGAAAEGAAALSEVGPPSVEEPPPAAAAPPLSKELQAPSGTATVAWILPVHLTLSPSAPPVPALSCSCTR